MRLPSEERHRPSLSSSARSVSSATPANLGDCDSTLSASRSRSFAASVATMTNTSVAYLKVYQIIRHAVANAEYAGSDTLHVYRGSQEILPSNDTQTFPQFVDVAQLKAISILSTQVREWSIIGHLHIVRSSKLSSKVYSIPNPAQ
jgi:hypothetical protein